jgi:phosphoglycolate phosphatase-like HAD superfamily hydrolase
MSNIILDFDGTIADTFEIVVGIFHELTHRNEVLPSDEIERLRGMSMLHAAEELRIQPWKMPLLMLRGRRRMTKRMLDIHTFPELQKVVRGLHSEGHNLYIVSSNSVQNIQLFLKRHEMHKDFIKVYGSVGLFDKAGAIKRIMRRNRLKRSETVYIGDEVRDIVAAKRAGIKIAAVTWGYNDKAVIAAHEPDFLVNEPIELLKLFVKP